MKTVMTYGMKVTLGDVDTESPVLCYKGGSIEGALHETCYCGGQYCKHEDSPREYNICIDAIESLVLALAVAGVDVTTPAFGEAIETAVVKMEQQYDS